MAISSPNVIQGQPIGVNELFALGQAFQQQAQQNQQQSQFDQELAEKKRQFDIANQAAATQFQQEQTARDNELATEAAGLYYDQLSARPNAVISDGSFKTAQIALENAKKGGRLPQDATLEDMLKTWDWSAQQSDKETTGDVPYLNFLLNSKKAEAQSKLDSIQLDPFDKMQLELYKSAVEGLSGLDDEERKKIIEQSQFQDLQNSFNRILAEHKNQIITTKDIKEERKGITGFFKDLFKVDPESIGINLNYTDIGKAGAGVDGAITTGDLELADSKAKLWEALPPSAKNSLINKARSTNKSVATQAQQTLTDKYGYTEWGETDKEVKLREQNIQGIKDNAKSRIKILRDGDPTLWNKTDDEILTDPRFSVAFKDYLPIYKEEQRKLNYPVTGALGR